MNLNENFGVSEAKMNMLRERIAANQINMNLIEETFVRGGGKGGQKVNKTANAVVLSYPPLSITVRCHRERKRSLNRFLALRELVDQVEMKVNPKASARLKKWNRLRKQKDRRRRRTHRDHRGDLD